MKAKGSSLHNWDDLKKRVLKTLDPIREASNTTRAEKDFLFTAKRTNVGRNLPDYYLCYFLFVELLGFKNLGKFEKIAWSVPLDYNGDAFLLEHRKFGLGIFAKYTPDQEELAKEIVDRICRAVKVAKPYFEWRASEAAKSHMLNVVNHHRHLFSRFTYFLDLYKSKVKEIEEVSGKRIVTKIGQGTSISYPEHEHREKAKWLALSALDSFFSWTEHIFIHVAILKGKVSTGNDVADLSESSWTEKFKAAIDLNDKEIKEIYDDLIVVKRQIRNYIAHGAFGKEGEAFHFHSGAGAVPLLLDLGAGRKRFSFYYELEFKEEEIISIVDQFLGKIWSEKLKVARFYIEYDLPLILTLARDGSYKSAMESMDKMERLVEKLVHQFEQSMNMDW